LGNARDTISFRASTGRPQSLKSNTPVTTDGTLTKYLLLFSFQKARKGTRRYLISRDGDIRGPPSSSARPRARATAVRSSPPPRLSRAAPPRRRASAAREAAATEPCADRRGQATGCRQGGTAGPPSRASAAARDCGAAAAAAAPQPRRGGAGALQTAPTAARGAATGAPCGAARRRRPQGPRTWPTEGGTPCALTTRVRRT